MHKTKRLEKYYLPILLLASPLLVPCSAQELQHSFHQATYLSHPAAERYLASSQPAHKQEKGAGVDWPFWASVGAYTAALGADIATTNDVFKRCAGCVEGGNLILRGTRPTVLNMVAASIPFYVMVVGYTAWARGELEGEKPAWLRHVPLLLPVAGAVMHARAAYLNSRVPGDHQRQLGFAGNRGWDTRTLLTKPFGGEHDTVSRQVQN